MSDSNWFSQAGSLDDSLDSGTTSIPTSVDSAPTSKDSVRSNNVSSTASTYIKPVKGLKEKTVASVRTGSETSNSNSTAMHVIPVKEETRCKKCGAVIPKGTTLCWKCSTSASVAGEKDVKREMHALVSPSEAFRGKNRKPIMIGAACLVLIIVIGIVVAISKSQKIDLKKLVCTDEILNYQLEDGTMIKSSIKSFEVISSSTKDKHDYSEVKVVLKDDFLERTLYISTSSTKYNQGWKVDSLSITDYDYQIVGDIDQKFIASKLGEDKEVNFADGGGWVPSRYINGVEKGFHNISLSNSYIDGYTYFAEYNVEDSYTYADISGRISVEVNVNMFYTETNSGMVRFNVSVKDLDISTKWHSIEGTYLLSIPEHQDQKQYITIDSSFNSYGYRECVAERFDNAVHSVDLSGTFYDLNYSTVAVCVVDPGDYYSYIDDFYEYIIFTPDEIYCKYMSSDGWSNYGDYTFEKIK